MSKWVRVEEGIVHEIIPTEATEPDVAHWYGEKFAAQCVEATDDVQQGWFYENGAFSDTKAITSDDLNAIKDNLIAKSKENLEEYLQQNPMKWTDGNYYSVTAEKQSLLTSQLALYQVGNALGTTYELRWNTSGGVCSVWTFANLAALSLAIGAYVKPLISYQQKKEEEINACTTDAALAAVVIDYSSAKEASESASST
jgi:hypothetical protein